MNCPYIRHNTGLLYKYSTIKYLGKRVLPFSNMFVIIIVI